MEEEYRYKDLHKEKVKLGEPQKLYLTCKDCDHSIPGEHININSNIAKCPICQTVFSFNVDSFITKRDRPEMMIPAGTDVIEFSESIDIRIDWLKSQPRKSIGVLTFFAVVWNGFIGIMAAGMISSGAISSLLYMSLHILVGLGLLFYIARIYLNFTDIIINQYEIRISERPIKIPFKSDIVLPINILDQLYVKKYVASTTNNIPNYAYALVAKTKKGNQIELIKGMNRETQLYLEQKVEKYLEIEDYPVNRSIVS